MHVGHCRGAVFGDALANLLAFAGYEVTREYYVNDAGGQVDVLARSVFLRYREALGEDIGEIPAGPLSRRLPEAASARRSPRSTAARCSICPEERWLPLVRDGARSQPMLADDQGRTSPRSTSATTCSSRSAR